MILERRAIQALGLVGLMVRGMAYALHAGSKWKQAEWDRDLAQLEAKARQTSEDYRVMEQAWQAENSRITGNYNASLEAQRAELERERAHGADLGKRLLRVSADLASRDRSAEVAGAIGAAYAAEITAREAEIAGALTAYDAACRADATQLAALIERVR